jgi:hypothetical protein
VAIPPSEEDAADEPDVVGGAFQGSELEVTSSLVLIVSFAALHASPATVVEGTGA